MYNKYVFSSELSPKEITKIITENGKTSKQREKMLEALAYYSGNNLEIMKKERVYYDKDHNKHENESASNVRNKSGFLRMLVQQKQDYALAKTFIFKLSTDNVDDVNIKEDDYGRAWRDFLDRTFHETVYRLIGDSVNFGIGWLYVWIDENQNLCVNEVPPYLIYPDWADTRHIKLDKLVYNYDITKYDSSTPERKEFAEYWTAQNRMLFEVTNSYQLVSEDISHMTNSQGEVSWGKIPFVGLKGTVDERTLLSFIKDQVDSYDSLDSRSIDGLIDDLDPTLVMKGISSQVSDLIEAKELAKLTRMIALDVDGDAKFIQAQTSIDAYAKKLGSLKQDIIRFGYGIDYEDVRFGGNPNQLIIKSLYQNLDTYVDGLERNFQIFINEFKYFFDKWCDYMGIMSEEECNKYKILVKFDRSILVNQSALIQDTINLAQTGVSKRTQMEFNPVVQDVDLEFSRIEEEVDELDLFDFENINGNDTEGTKPIKIKQAEL
jgi:SPP1 family phage portal protein